LSSVIFSTEAYASIGKRSRKQSGVKKIEQIFTGFIFLLLGIIVLELGFHFLIAPSVRIDLCLPAPEDNHLNKQN